MSSSSSKKEVKMVCGMTLYPTSDPNRVAIKMNDPAIKTYTGEHRCFTSPIMSQETLDLLSRYNSKSKHCVTLHGFGIPKNRPAQHVATQPETGGPKPKGIVPYSNETKVSSDPDPCLLYVPPPDQFGSALPPRMSYAECQAADAALKADLAASIALIEARSAIAIAATPAVPRYWEDPSKMKASEAAATS